VPEAEVLLAALLLCGGGRRQQLANELGPWRMAAHCGAFLMFT